MQIKKYNANIKNSNRMNIKLYYLMFFLITFSSCSKWEIFNKKGAEQSQELPRSPVVSTGKLVDGNETYAVISGDLLDLSNDVVIQFGHCWSTSKQEPTIEDSKSSLGIKTNIGSFSSTLTNLTLSSTYYVRSYAVNKAGVSYGSVITFVAKTQNFLNVTFPVSGLILKKGKTYDLKWSENANNNVKIDLLVNGAVFQNITSSTAGTGIFSWKVTTDLPEANNYSIKITSAKNINTFGESTPFTITNDAVPPTVITSLVNNISEKYAVASANISTDGGSTILERGICYGVLPNANINGTKTTEAGTIGAFSSILNNLQAKTKYYIRAFATSRVGTSYGAELTFTTLEKVATPTVSLPINLSITSTVGVFNVNVSSDGGSPVINRGVCWSATNVNPTDADNVVSSGTGIGEFKIKAQAFFPNSPIYVRSFAQNAVGTGYSEPITVTTLTTKAPLINFVNVKGGTFSMGNVNGVNAELPVHTVILKDYSISTYEITNKEYAHFLNEYQSNLIQYESKIGNTILAAIGQTIIVEDPMGITKNGLVWTPQSGYENNPVVGVTWYGAFEFCRFYGFRLPTEAEWEYAAKGGINKNTYKYSGGDNLNDFAWYYDNSLSATSPVGLKTSNSIGVFDMNGNVWEWVNDFYGSYLSATQSNPTGPVSGTKHVMRGGSRNSTMSDISTTFRSSSSPDFKHTTIGFRIAK